MNYSSGVSIPKKKTLEHERVILNSGLFLLDEDQKPIALFQLRGDNRKLYTTKLRTITGIDPLALRVMIRKLNKCILNYKYDMSDSQKIETFVDDLANDFHAQILKLIHNYNIQEEELEPQFSRFIQKADKIVRKRSKEDWFLQPSGQRKKAGRKEKQARYQGLIYPIKNVFRKYLKNLETGKRDVRETNILHYISHLLIACGLESLDPDRGHKPIFEKIKMYEYRIKQKSFL